MKTEAQLQEAIQAIEGQRQAIFDKIAPLKDQLLQLYEELTVLKDQHGQLVVDRMKAAGGPSPQEWQEIIRKPDSGSMTMYRYIDAELYNMGILNGGSTWSDTNERALTIGLVKDDGDSIRQVERAIRFFTPMLTPHTKDERTERKLDPEEGGGYIWFSISDHHASYYGSYRLMVTPDLKEVAVAVMKYGSLQILNKFTTLTTALGYVAHNHYYRLKEE